MPTSFLFFLLIGRFLSCYRVRENNKDNLLHQHRCKGVCSDAYALFSFHIHETVGRRTACFICVIVSPLIHKDRQPVPASVYQSVFFGFFFCQEEVYTRSTFHTNVVVVLIRVDGSSLDVLSLTIMIASRTRT